MHIRPFEIALIGIFAISALVGLFFLSKYEPDDSAETTLYGDNITMWGTFEESDIQGFLTDLVTVNPALKVVTYERIDPRRFQTEFVNAVAEGRAPDIVIMSQTFLVSERQKLQAISYESIPERTFRDTYIDGAEIYMMSDGVYGLPFAVDPLLMYWNRDILSSSGLAQPPKTWESLMTQAVPAIVRTNDELSLTQSAVSFGEYTNVVRAKETLAMLLFQSGSSIVEEENGNYRVTISEGDSRGLTPADAVLGFYTQFSTPSSALYSWNRAKSKDRFEFLGGTLAFYFGLGSERSALEIENPNLNVDVAPVPQGSGATIKRTYGDFYAFGIPRSGRNIQGAYAVASILSNPVNATRLADILGFAPVHREAFVGNTGDSFKDILMTSALIARGWLDPNPQGSDQIFRDMIEAVASGRTRFKEAILDGVYALESLF